MNIINTAANNTEVIESASVNDIGTTIAIISVVVAIVGTLIMPYVVYKFKIYKLNEEMKDFEKLIAEMYIKDLNNLIENYDLDSDVKIKKCIDDKIAKLSYLKSEELIHLNSDNQFKMIRLVEFTKAYIKNISDVINMHGILQPFHSEETEIAENIKISKVFDLKEKALTLLKQGYENNKTDYTELRKDYLIENIDQFKNDLNKNIQSVTSD